METLSPLQDELQTDLALVNDKINRSRPCREEIRKRLGLLRDEQWRIDYISSWKAKELDNLLGALQCFDSSSTTKLIHKLRGGGCQDVTSERKVLKEIITKKKVQADQPISCSALQELAEFTRRSYDWTRRNDRKRGWYKQILEELRALEEMVNEKARKSKRGHACYSKKSIQDQIKLINKTVEKSRMEERALMKEIDKVQKELDDAHTVLDELFEESREIEEKLERARMRKLGNKKDVGAAVEQLFYEKRRRSNKLGCCVETWLANSKQLHPPTHVLQVNVRALWDPQRKGSAAIGFICRDWEGDVIFAMSIGSFTSPNILHLQASATCWAIKEARRHGLTSVLLELELDSEPLATHFNHDPHIFSPFYYFDSSLDMSRRLATSFTSFSISFIHGFSNSVAHLLAEKGFCRNYCRILTWDFSNCPSWLSRALVSSN